MKQNRKILSGLMVFLFTFTTFLSGTIVSVEAKTTKEIKKVLENGNEKYKAEDEVLVIVQLNEKAAKDYDSSLSLQKAANNSEIMDKVLKSQEKYKENIQKIDRNAVFNREYYVLLNGFTVKTKFKNIEKIQNIEGVKEVTLDNQYTYKPNMANAKDITNVKKVWNELKYKGEGMVISVIDSGVDYTHKDMRISDGVEVKLTKADVDKSGLKGKFFTNKIPYGYNYVDDNYDIIDKGSMHGMHVAGISAANGKDEEAKLGEAIKGVAPEAQVLAMKVFGNNPNSPFCTTEDVVSAIEDSVALGADVINMSLGASAAFQDPNDPEQVAVREAAEKGVLCVISAGNSSFATAPYKFGDLVDSGLVGAPGLSHESLMVASCENNIARGTALQYNAGEESGLIVYTQSVANPVDVLKEEYELVECGIGAVPGNLEDEPEANDFEGKDLKGKIALIQRGKLAFATKALNAEKAGAVGVIIYNHETGGDGITGMTGFGESNTIPVTFIGHSFGEKLNELIASGVKVKFEGKDTEYENPDKDDISSFSSWGPTPNLDFKPEITAPGGDIWSTLNDDKYGIMSGTSMAAPHTTGVMALIAQHIKNMNIKFNTPEEKVNFAKTLAMNTAVVRKDPATGDEVPFSPRRMGAGFIDAKAAIDNFVTVTDAATGEAAVALKEFNNNTKAFELTLKNYGDKDVVYSVKDRSGVLTEQSETIISGMTYDVKIEGADVSFSKKEINVPAGKTASVKVTIKLPEETSKNKFVEGFIGFESKTEGAVSIGIPYMGFYGEWDKPIIVDLPVWDENCYWGETYLKTIDKFEEGTPLGVTGQGENGPIYNKNKIAINGKSVVLPEMTFFRNVKNLVIDIVDEKDNVIRNISIDHKLSKNVFDDDEYTVDKSHWAWDGTAYNTETSKFEVVPDGQYYFAIKGVVDYEGAEYQTVKLPVKVDTKVPVIYDVNVSNGKLSFKAVDEFSGIKDFLVKVKDDIVKDADGNSIRKVEVDKNGIYTIDIDLGERDELALYAEDFAGNVGKYTMSVGEAAEEITVVVDGFSNRAESEEGILLNSNKVTINGFVNKKAKVLKIMDKEVSVNDDLTFETEVEFDKLGPNKLIIYAEGEDGEKCNYAYTVQCDNIAPELKLAGIDENNETSLVFVDEDTDYYNVTGIVKDNLYGYKLFVNGNQIDYVQAYGNPEDTVRQFSKLIKLEGKYVNTIEVKAVDSYENETVKKLLVMKDTSKTPKFEIDCNLEKENNNEKTLEVSVKVNDLEKLHKVMINGEECSLVDGVYEGKVKLTEVDQIVITAIDKLGNQTVKFLPARLLKNLLLR